MTNKEASKVLEHIKSNENYELYIDKEDVEALTLAIKALEECANNAQGDLISRSALLTELRNCPYVVDFNYVLKIIENAPTVETTFREVVAYECGQKSVERPQGEWIDHSEEEYVECPFCEHLTNCEGNIDELHYCWNCGAKMQKGGRE